MPAVLNDQAKLNYFLCYGEEHARFLTVAQLTYSSLP